MIAPMDRVEIVCLRSELAGMVPVLQEQGVVHVEEVSLALENHPGFLHRVHLPGPDKLELAEMEALEILLKETRPLLASGVSLESIAAAAPAIQRASFADQSKFAKSWHRTLRTLHRRKLNTLDDIAVIKNYGLLIESITPLLIGSGSILGETARAIILEGYSPDALDALRRDVCAAVSPACKFIDKKLDRNKFILVITHPAGKGDPLAEFLSSRNIKVLSSPDQDARGTSVDEVMRKIGGRISEMQADLDAILSELGAFTRQEGPRFLALDRIVRDRIGQLRVVDSFAQSEMVGVVHGWVPSGSYEALKAALVAKFGAKVIVGKLSHKGLEHQRIPTKLQNHAIFKPFELILKLMRPATYGALDPTALVAVSFILFYGFILGDVGYGLIIVAIGAWGKKKWGHIEAVRDGMTIFTYMGYSAIVFGFIYWEIFGNFVEHAIGGHALFHRAHETTILLYLGIAFGVVHIPLSLVLGIREGFHHGHNKHAEEKLGLLLGLGALVLALATSAGYFPLGGTFGYVLALLLAGSAAYYMVRSMGAMAPMGAMEVIGLTANILSYSRLMALGVASIAFADIANAMPEMLGGGFIGFVIGVPAALAVHALNIGIGVFSPTIHSLRLNFVEFLPKFYDPNGRMYEPFRKEMAW